MRHVAPARTSQRKPLKISRKECVRCGAASVIKVK
jgi:ribosomal protein S27AE